MIQTVRFIMTRLISTFVALAMADTKQFKDPSNKFFLVRLPSLIQNISGL